MFCAVFPSVIPVEEENLDRLGKGGGASSLPTSTVAVILEKTISSLAGFDLVVNPFWCFIIGLNLRSALIIKFTLVVKIHTDKASC